VENMMFNQIGRAIPFDQKASEAYIAWLRKNSWYNLLSPDFDPELRRITDEYAAQLEYHLCKRNRLDIIITKKFLNEIDKYVKSEAHVVKRMILQAAQRLLRDRKTVKSRKPTVKKATVKKRKGK
jgi:hypothetical protein